MGRRQKKMLQIAKLQTEREEKQESELLDGNNASKIDLSAIRSIYDPQAFVQKLFQRLIKNKYLWDIRLLKMNLISRCISTHQLLLFPFYSFIIKYLKTSQKNITQIIAYCAQSIHKLVPPEIIRPIIRHIADGFVGQFSCKESIAVGINAIRLICKRQPIAMDIDLLHDLAQYVKYKKDAGVQMAARALIHLYRIENPNMLKQRDRGKYHTQNADILDFGEEKITKNIPGAELFEKEEQMLCTKVYITKSEAMFMELDEDGSDDEDDSMDGVYADSDVEDVRYHIVANDKEREEKKEKPLLIRRVLSEEDLARLKELRVSNLMKIWNKERDEIGLNEERESDGKIDVENEVESATVLRQKFKERRKEAMKNNPSSNQRTWDEYRREHGGGSTNKEKARKKPFVMTKYAMKVIKKGKRSIKLQKMIKGQHKRTLKKEGKRAKRRRR